MKTRAAVNTPTMAGVEQTRKVKERKKSIIDWLGLRAKKNTRKQKLMHYFLIEKSARNSVTSRPVGGIFSPYIQENKIGT